MDKFSGVFAPTVTAFHYTSGDLDLEWITQLLSFLKRRGCDGVVPAGTTGEGPSLGFDERRRLIDHVVAHADGMTVIAGTGTPSLTDTIELTRHAFRSGVDGVLVLPPYYYRAAPVEGIADYFRRLCDRALEPGQRIFLYHIPRVSGVPVTHGMLDSLMATHAECVGGLKDSSGDPESLRSFIQRYPRLRVFCGSDSLARLAYTEGAAGTITVMANLIPDRLQALRRMSDLAEANRLQAYLTRARQTLRAYPTQAAFKYALHRIAGLPETATRPPNVELTFEQQVRLDRDLIELGLVSPT
ncbi:MAG: dihydrodipicolinate synthase family protein [Anaerolineae bacterium]|nr:dihydrodipicolinate synthase family protein [Anaerolineae bacterium]